MVSDSTLMSSGISPLVTRSVELESGLLTLQVSRADLSLDELLGFAARANPRRGFLFVSRVLGKHIPCPPRQMRAVYEQLADHIGPLNDQAFVVGMAETATGLGAGVADSLARRHKRGQISYQHTTRHLTEGALWVTFDESHSHAPDQLLYQPLETLQEPINRSRTLILVDDEITSGRTLTELGRALTPHWSSQLSEILIVSIVSWLSEERRRALEESFEVPVRCVSLLEGEYAFTSKPGFHPTIPGQVSASKRAEPARRDLGRCALEPLSHVEGLTLSFERLKSRLTSQRPVTVIGTGELAYQPFLLAEYLERSGFDVLYQSSTRSPILLGGAITQSLMINDEHGEGVSNYLHNPPSSDERQIVIAYESMISAQRHQLPKQLNALHWVCPLSETANE